MKRKRGASKHIYSVRFLILIRIVKTIDICFLHYIACERKQYDHDFSKNVLKARTLIANVTGISVLSPCGRGGFFHHPFFRLPLWCNFRTWSGETVLEWTELKRRKKTLLRVASSGIGRRNGRLYTPRDGRARGY